MKRVGLALVAVTAVVVAYLAAAEGSGRAWLDGWLGSPNRVPELQTAELPFRYPARLWREGIEGEVLLRLRIAPNGVVDSVILERSSGHAELDREAMSGAGRLKYDPAASEDSAAVWALLPVRFQRDASGPAEGSDDEDR